MKHFTTAVFAAALMLASAACGMARRDHGGEETEAQLSSQARIPEPQARDTALARVPNGQVRSHELEREHDRLIYSYDIAVPGKTGIEEVAVDAITGQVVTVEHESPADERREAREDSSAPAGSR